ncbi:hypothetical protein ADUPG1_010342, partial [Aduncisulcus paluster]
MTIWSLPRSYRKKRQTRPFIAQLVCQHCVVTSSTSSSAPTVFIPSIAALSSAVSAVSLHETLALDDTPNFT